MFKGTQRQLSYKELNDCYDFIKWINCEKLCTITSYNKVYCKEYKTIEISLLKDESKEYCDYIDNFIMIISEKNRQTICTIELEYPNGSKCLFDYFAKEKINELI